MTPADGDDAGLVAAALTGDRMAFTTLMGRHKDAIYRFVRRYVGDADEAFDLVQETFVACWSALDSFDPKRSFPTWLRRIALNKCRDWSRRRRVREFFFRALPLEAAASRISTLDPETDVDANEAQAAKLDAAIAALPPTLKEPLLLTVFEGLTHLEVANLLGISVKAVELRVYRAKQRLRQGVDFT